MLLQPPGKFNFYILVIICIAAVVPGCITPRKYQPGKPFVFSTNINIQGNLRPGDKADLKTRLENQLDDSLKTQVVTTFPGFKRLSKPAAYDTVAVARSIGFMKSLLYSLGYYKATITSDTSRAQSQLLKIINLKKGEKPIRVQFTVTPGKSYKFDSIAYNLEDSALQQLTLSRRNNALIKKGDPYSVENISAEMDRLVDIFRNNGYYKFSKEDLLAERDTVFAKLIDPSLDPFERLQLLEEAQRRQQTPTMDIVLKLKHPELTSHFQKYYIRNVAVYPDLDLVEDSTQTIKDSVTINKLSIYNKYNKFKPKFIAGRVALLPGEMFRQRNSIKTYNNFTQLNAWTQVSVEIKEAPDSLPLLDVIIKMYPTKKQDINLTLDASYNTGDVLATGNLFGVGVNLGLNNRNVGKQAIQSSSNVRTGVELGKDFIQTFQTNLSHTISFPKLILPFKFIRTDSLLSQRTLLNFNAGYTDRRDFYELRSLNASWGWEISKRGKRRRTTHTWFYSPLNVEYVQLNPRQKLQDLLNNVPNLAYSFNTGLVISQVVNYNFGQTKTNPQTKTVTRNLVKASLEESGGLFGLIDKLDQKGNLFRYVKIDGDYRHFLDHPKSTWAFRLYAGIGIPYGKDIAGNREQQLPFFKSFYAGGPYSMRAWQVRQLGVGSSIKLDTINGTGIDRFGDIQLEGNIEYRFDVGSIFGFKIKSALFTDIGNIWYRNNLNDPQLDSAVFKFSRLYQDIAVAAGTSLRVDFGFFLVRFDWAYKIKNPIYANKNDGWFQNLQLKRGQFQLGVGYPF